jgi:hypothetical protein
MSGLLIIRLFAVAVFAVPTTSQAATISVGISVGIAPPPIPVYTQPVCPGPGYMWTPGYWAYDPENGYFWVPGTWVVAPAPGLLWTPGYWGWGGAAFIWHAGYWGPHVGFYGGINYGFGYTGVGFVGGEWRGRDFFYNRSVVNIGGAHITNIYYRSVPNNFAVNRVSYNGGRGGINVRPGREELAAEHDRHMEATSLQHQHEMGAHNDRSQFASINHGAPGVAATGRPGAFRGAGVVQSSRAGGTVNPGGYHSTSAGHTNGYSGFHNPNPSGGGNHQVMTAHPNAPSWQGSSPRQGGTASGGFHSAPISGFHPTSPSHSGPSGGSVSNHETFSHQGQSGQHGSQPSSQGGHSEKGGHGGGHESDPHH